MFCNESPCQEVLGVWIFGVPLAFVAAIYFHAGIEIVYLCVCLEDVFKVSMTVPRLKSGKWIRRLIYKSPIKPINNF